MAKLNKIVLKSSEVENPFRRKRRGIFVPAMSTETIREFADKVRSTFVEDIQIEFPIMDVLQFLCGKVSTSVAIEPTPQTIYTCVYRVPDHRRQPEAILSPVQCG